MGNPIWRGLGTGQCHWKERSSFPYLVLINIFVPSNNDPLLNPRLRKPSFHSLQGEREARSALGPAGPAAVTGNLSEYPSRSWLEPAVTSPGSLRLFLFWLGDFRLQIWPSGHHSPNHQTVPFRSPEPRSNALPDPGWQFFHLPASVRLKHQIHIPHVSGPLPFVDLLCRTWPCSSDWNSQGQGCLLFISVSPPPHPSVQPDQVRC